MRCNIGTKAAAALQNEPGTALQHRDRGSAATKRQRRKKEPLPNSHNSRSPQQAAAGPTSHQPCGPSSACS